MGTVTFKTQIELDQESLEAKRDNLVVSKFQAKAALKNAGLLKDVQDLLAGLPEDDLAVLAWNDAQEFRRKSAVMVSIASQLGMTETELDYLFEQAKEIEA